MSMIKVTSDDLQQRAGQIQAAASRIEDEITARKGQIDAMTGGEWMGAASSQFATLYGNFNTSAMNLKQSMDGIGQLLQGAATTYAQTEQELASRIGGA